MKTARLLTDPHSRRRFFTVVGVSVAGGSAAFIAACGGDGEDDGGPEGDLDILNGALELEHGAVAAYTEGASLLEGETARLGRRLLQHEQAHVEGLSAAITELGGKPRRAKKSYPFPNFRDQDDVLRFAYDLEQTAVAAYMDAIPKLSSGALRATAVQLATNEAEHIAVLLGVLGRPQTPDAFVKGARKVEL
jgi:rubrerythrin